MIPSVSAVAGDGVAVFVRKGWTATRRLADGTSITAQELTRIVEWRTADGVITRTLTVHPQVRFLSVSLAGDVFFLFDDAVHSWRRGPGTIERLCDVTPPTDFGPMPSVSPDGTHVAHLQSGKTHVAITELATGVVDTSVETPPDDWKFMLGNRGAFLLFYRDVTVQSGSGWTEWIIDRTARGLPRLVASLLGDEACVGVSEDGEAVEWEGRENGRLVP